MEQWPEPELATPRHTARAITVHSQQPPGSCFSSSRIRKFTANGATEFEAISRRLCSYTFSAQLCLPAQLCLYSALLSRFILFDHSCVFVVCVSEAMLHCLYGLRCLRLELNGNRKKKRKEAPQPVSLHQSWQLLLFHITRSPLAPIFIATHLSPCHHICIHPPANYTAPFPQTTLISNDVFSACVGIRNINGG